MSFAEDNKIMMDYAQNLLRNSKCPISRFRLKFPLSRDSISTKIR